MKIRSGLPTVLALVAGGLILLALGRWDGMVSARDAQTIRDARALLQAGAGYRARLGILGDSLAAYGTREAMLRALAGRQAADLDSLRAVEARGAALSGPLDSLAPGLGLRPHPDGWLADSGTVRHLARLAWRSEVRLPAAEALVVTLDSLWRANAALVEVYATRSALAEARVTALEASLRDVVHVADCRIVLGLLPCPSRTMSFVVGIGLGVVGGFLLAR